MEHFSYKGACDVTCIKALERRTTDKYSNIEQ